MKKAHQPGVTDLAELGLCGLMAASWVGALTYLSQLTAGPWLWQTPLLAPSVLLTFLAGFYYAKGREVSFYLVKKRSAAGFSLQAWLAGLVLPAIFHRLVEQVITVGAVDPSSIFSFSVFLNSILLMATWWWSVATGSELRGLDVQTGELPDSRGFRYENPAASSNRRKCFRRLRGRWLAGVVALATVIAILDSSSKQPDLPALEVGLYLSAGFGLLALTNLVRMRSIWKIDLVTLPARLVDRWMSSAFAVIAAGLVIAILLPAGYAGFIPATFALLIGNLTSVSISVSAPLFSSHQESGTVMPRQEMPAQLWEYWLKRPATPPDSVSQPPAPAPKWSLSEPALTALLWVVVAIGLYLALRFVWQRRDELQVLEILSDLARLLRLAILTVIAFVLGAAEVASQTSRYDIDTIVRQRSRALLGRVPAFRLRYLDERGWLEYMLLSLFRRAQKLGYQRSANMTAAEYATRVQSGLPEVGPGLSRLVDRFHQSRYGERSISNDELEEAKGWWSRIKLLLQRARVQMPRDRRRRQTDRTKGSAGPARHYSRLQANSVERTQWLGVVNKALGTVRAVLLVAIFLLGLVAIWVIQILLAVVLDPGVLDR